MKHFFMMLLMTSFIGSMAIANEHGEQDDAICPALLESNTRSVKSVPVAPIKAPTKSGSTAQ